MRGRGNLDRPGPDWRILIVYLMKQVLSDLAKDRIKLEGFRCRVLKFVPTPCLTHNGTKPVHLKVLLSPLRLP